MELGDLQQNDESGEKAPRRVIHFSSGETMEEYSTEDEEDHTHTQPDKNNLLSSVDTVCECERACVCVACSRVIQF